MALLFDPFFPSVSPNTSFSAPLVEIPRTPFPSPPVPSFKMKFFQFSKKLRLSTRIPRRHMLRIQKKTFGVAIINCQLLGFFDCIFSLSFRSFTLARLIFITNPPASCGRVRDGRRMVAHHRLITQLFSPGPLPANATQRFLVGGVSISLQMVPSVRTPFK